jgi:hypothetical protein
MADTKWLDETESIALGKSAQHFYVSSDELLTELLVRIPRLIAIARAAEKMLGLLSLEACPSTNCDICRAITNYREACK